MIRRFLLSTLAVIAIVMSSNAQKGKSRDTSIPLKAPAGKAIAAFAEGCFWCSEHIFEALVGVDSATSGYAGGTAINPSYELVNTETTGHAESVLVYYDPKVISYGDLLKAFFTSHDPTTVDRQGPDQGNSYRSIIFYSTPAEKQLAEQAKKSFASSFKDPIVSEIKPLNAFYRAEGYHQNFVDFNPNNPYVQGVSMPRFDKFKRTCKLKLR